MLLKMEKAKIAICFSCSDKLWTNLFSAISWRSNALEAGALRGWYLTLLCV